MFTGLLIAASAGVVAFAGHLLRRLFTTTPALDGYGAVEAHIAETPDGATR
jgi:hypothetical protein